MGSSESTHVKMPRYWKSHALAQLKSAQLIIRQDEFRTNLYANIHRAYSGPSLIVYGEARYAQVTMNYLRAISRYQPLPISQK